MNPSKRAQTFTGPLLGGARLSGSALARMRSYEGKKITSPSRGFKV